MADFKTALEALAEGKIDIDALGVQLEKLLQDNPKFAVRMLTQLDEMFEQTKIDEESYTKLKRQINQYRREHASETETDEDQGDATEFAKEEQVFDPTDDSEDSTVMREDGGVDSEESTVIRGDGGDGSEESTVIHGDGGDDSEESTVIRGDGGDDSEESTVIRGDGGGSEDATAVQERPASPDATQVLEERPEAADGSDFFDISMPGSDTDGFSSVTSGTGPTGTGWQEPMQQGGYVPGKEYGPGDIIKQRFKLLKVLGIGGMGKVYMATDLLKEEARDKKPNVAIKLLNDDFKDHPEAFISLQRESSRQQKLAHPNIATIYDFDRVGGPGTPVFITMELMEGMELKDFIKKKVRKQGGLPFEEVLPIVKQLGDGLIYAHDKRLVHSDFKPGNAFLCNDGTVKTLDFGIARAVKNPVTGEAEKTLFDPGKLGALTPAYASLEMLEGEEPDTRDDTYALGCVAYELLTGKHPFNKLPATTAKENGLVPPYVKTVNKKTNRALRRAVAFHRADRSPTVEHFLEEFEGLPTWHKNPFTIAAGVLLIIGLMFINPAIDYFHTKKIAQIIADINTGNRQTIITKLEEIKELETTEQAQITNEAKDAIQKYYAGEIATQIDTLSDSYNFPTAYGILQTVEKLYPDSGFLLEQTDAVNFNKKQKEAELYQQYIAATDPNAARQDPTIIDSTKQILNTIKQRIDPSHPLLTDPRPANAYRLAAEQAFEDQDFEQALTLVASGMQTAPDDARLQDLQTKVTNAKTVADLNQSLGDVQTELVALGDYKQYQEDITKLASLSTPEQSPVLGSLSEGLKKNITTELNRVLKEGTRADAETMAGEYGGLLSALLLGRELTQIKLAHLSGDDRKQAVAQLVNTDLGIIQEKLASPALDDVQWETELLASVRELDTLQEEAPDVVAELASARDTIAQLYVDRANDTLKANRFDAAATFVDKGERFAPGLAILQESKQLVAESKAEFERQERIKDWKEQFNYQTEADQVAQAQQLFDNLKAELPEDDRFIRQIGPSTLADSYARLAQRRTESGDTANAYKLAVAGLELMPNHAELLGLRNDLRVEVNIAELTEVFKDARVFTSEETIQIARKKNDIERGDPSRYAEFLANSETIIAERIAFLAQTDENSAAALANSALTIFPVSSVFADLADQYKLEDWDGFPNATAALDGGELTRASNLLQEAVAGDNAGHPQVLEFQKMLEEKVKQANTGFDRYVVAKNAAGESFKDLRQAKKLLGRVQSIWIDNPDYDAAETELDELIANAPDNPAKKLLAREQPTDFSQATEEDLVKAAQEWKPVSSGRECADNLAGYGKRARAVCFDLVNTGWRGPLMVVIPAGEETQNMFAIGKYELSIGDWSKYCALTGNCKPETNKEKFNDPVTGVTLADAQKYTDWLSQRTGKTYRLPTRAEWEYAANAAGKQPQKDVNCRVTLGDKILKGTGIVSIKSGKSNGWGLKNYIGNVQEWLIDDTGTIAAGGSYSDAHSKCDISLQRPHSGDADSATGFRILLEEVG